MENQILNIINDFAYDTRNILKDNLIEEYVFGSYVRGEQTELSDIDILIIVKHFDYKIRREVSSLSSDYSLERGVIISPIIKDINIWKKNQEYNTLFYSEIKRNSIKL